MPAKLSTYITLDDQIMIRHIWRKRYGEVYKPLSRNELVSFKYDQQVIDLIKEYKASINE